MWNQAVSFFKRTKILRTACEFGLSLISLALSQRTSHLGLNTNINMYFAIQVYTSIFVPLTDTLTFLDQHGDKLTACEVLVEADDMDLCHIAVLCLAGLYTLGKLTGQQRFTRRARPIEDQVLVLFNLEEKDKVKNTYDDENLSLH